MEMKKKILQIMRQDELSHKEHCEQLLEEKDLTLDEVGFLSQEIGDSVNYIQKITWYLKGV